MHVNMYYRRLLLHLLKFSPGAIRLQNNVYLMDMIPCTFSHGGNYASARENVLIPRVKNWNINKLQLEAFTEAEK